MTDLEQELKRFEEKYLDTENKEYFSSYLKEARDLIRDLNYFREHINRTAVSKRFGLSIIPQTIGLPEFFSRRLFQKRMSWYGLNEDRMVETIKLFDITSKLFSMTEYGNNLNIVDEITKWANVIGYYSGLNLREHVHHFIGCSRGVEAVSKKLDELLNNKD